MSSLDYFLVSNGLAITQYPEDSFITYYLVSCFLLLCALPLITYFKNSVLQTLVCIGDSIKCTYFYIAYIFESLQGLYIIWKELKQLQPQDQHHQLPKTGNLLVQISPPPEELLTEVREQLIHLHSQNRYHLFRTFTRIPRYVRQNTYYIYIPLTLV